VILTMSEMEIKRRQPQVMCSLLDRQLLVRERDCRLLLLYLLQRQSLQLLFKQLGGTVFQAVDV